MNFCFSFKGKIAIAKKMFVKILFLLYFVYIEKGNTLNLNLLKYFLHVLIITHFLIVVKK